MEPFKVQDALLILCLNGKGGLSWDLREIRQIKVEKGIGKISRIQANRTKQQTVRQKQKTSNYQHQKYQIGSQKPETRKKKLSHRQTEFDFHYFSLILVSLLIRLQLRQCSEKPSEECQVSAHSRWLDHKVCSRVGSVQTHFPWKYGNSILCENIRNLSGWTSLFPPAYFSMRESKPAPHFLTVYPSGCSYWYTYFEDQRWNVRENIFISLKISNCNFSDLFKFHKGICVTYI